jgi:hypothetical protein
LSFAYCLPFVRVVNNSEAASLHGNYSASTLLPAPPPPSRLQPTSRCRRLYGFTAPRISAWGEEGFSSCIVHPCRRAVATTPPVCPAASVRLQRAMPPSPVTRGLGHWSSTFRGHLCLYFRYGPTTRSPSFKMALSMDSQSSVSLPLAIQATGLLTFVPVGLTPLNTPAFRELSA